MKKPGIVTSSFEYRTENGTLCCGKLKNGMCGEAKKCCKKYKRGKKPCKSCPKH